MKLLIIIFSVLLLSSCAPVSREYHIPKSGVDYITASWYGPKFHGRPTASGERFDMYALTAAHKSLKFGTRLRVTNTDSRKSVIVTINDRGPFIRGRDLDLSYGAAEKIGLVEKGVGRVRIEYLGRDNRYVKRVPFTPAKITGPLVIQVGSFAEKSNAFRLKRSLETKYKKVFVTRAHIRGKKYFRVKIGEFRNRNNALTIAQKLADEGYSVIITSRN